MTDDLKGGCLVVLDEIGDCNVAQQNLACQGVVALAYAKMMSLCRYGAFPSEEFVMTDALVIEWTAKEYLGYLSTLSLAELRKEIGVLRRLHMRKAK